MPHYPPQRCWWRGEWGWSGIVGRGGLSIPFYRIWCWWIFLRLYWFFFLFYWCPTKIFTSLFTNCIFSILNGRSIPWGYPWSCWVLPPRGLVFGFRPWCFRGWSGTDVEWEGGPARSRSRTSIISGRCTATRGLVSPAFIFWGGAQGIWGSRTLGGRCR